jgi:hypothetical protein
MSITITNERKPLVFLITGVARAGKDTFASALIEEMERSGNRVELFKFSNLLKAVTARCLEWLDLTEDGKKPAEIAFTESEELKPIVREVLVALGKLGRHIEPGVFARHLITDISGFIEFCPNGDRPVAVVSDWRYVNEYEFCKKYLDANVITIEIMRPGYDADNDEEEKSIKDIFLKINIDHRRMASNPAMLKSMAKEIANIYK